MQYLTAFLVILFGLFALSSGLEFLSGALSGAVGLSSLPGKGGMLALNITTVIQGVSYAVFLVLMDKVLFQPMLVHLDKRQGTIKEAEETADKAETAVRKVKREREAKLAEAFREAGQAKIKIKAKAVGDYQELVHQARKDADAMVEEAREQVEAEAAEAEKALEGDLGELGGLIRSKLLREEAEA